ncbi:MAG: insulinase family protein [Melioribacteraceae bacterium]|nr:insulinase family protein [Melioribacteraceae bacterium]
MSNHLNLQIRKYQLDNGLTTILYPQTNVSTVAVNLWYRVGSANEKNGKTGFAHLFEHMMFQGSKHIPKEAHFKFVQEAGGSLNASTGHDRTNYFETLPADSLELALWLESDRMGFMLDSLSKEKLTNQKNVVMNERRERYENQPYGLAFELLFSNLFSERHPYHWPVIGWMKDIDNFSLDDVKDFFKTYYSPNNASLVVAGNFEEKTAEYLIQKYFGEFKPSNNIPQIELPQTTLSEHKVIIHKDEVQLERIYLAWESEKYYGKFDASLDFLSELLTGSKSGRLSKSLLFEKQIVQDISAFQFSAKHSGMFLIVATAKQNIALDVIKDEIFSEIKRLMDDGIDNYEFERVKNSYKSSFIYSLQNIENVANLINGYNFYLNNPNGFEFDYNRYDKVEKEDVIKSAEKFITENFIELKITPQKQTC